MLSSVLMIGIIAVAAGAAVASARCVPSGWARLALAVLTAVIAIPLWITCDGFLLRLLPTVWWFDPAEPFAPYLLLYLPLSFLIAVTPAAALIMLVRAFHSRGWAARAPKR